VVDAVSLSQNLAVIYVPVSAIKPRPGNPRKHSQQQLRKLMRIVEEHGFTNPILVDESNVIIAGHLRYEVALSLGMEEAPVIRLTGLSEAQKRAVMVSDNKIAEESEWDPKVLAQTLQSIIDLDYDPELTGFDTGELNRLLNYAEAEGQDSDDDEGCRDPNRDVAPVTRPGDTWVLGSHRLHCGDALEYDSYEAVLGSETAQMIITDPPFNVETNGHASGHIHHGSFVMAPGEMAPWEFMRFLTTMMHCCIRYSVDGSLHYIFMDWGSLFELLAASRGAGYAELKNLCVWTKPNAGMGSFYRSQHELIAVFKNGRAPHINHVELGSRNRTNVWNYPGVSSFGANREEYLAIHPTVKPVKLVADAILDGSQINDIILDCFGGSGTALLACHRTGRRCAMIEIDPHYVDVAILRFEKAAGIKAVHAATGLPFEEMRALRASESGAAE
jgi:DNA modification methylase